MCGEKKKTLSFKLCKFNTVNKVASDTNVSLAFNALHIKFCQGVLVILWVTLCPCACPINRMFYDYSGGGIKDFFKHLLVFAYFCNVLRFQLCTNTAWNFLFSCWTGWSIHLSWGSSCNLHHNSSLAGEQKILANPLPTLVVQAWH